MEKVFLVLSLILCMQSMNAASMNQEIIKESLKLICLYSVVSLSANFGAKCYNEAAEARRLIKAQKQQKISTTVSQDQQYFFLHNRVYALKDGDIKTTPYTKTGPYQFFCDKSAITKVVDVSVIKNKFRKWAAGLTLCSVAGCLGFYGFCKLAIPS